MRNLIILLLIMNNIKGKKMNIKEKINKCINKNFSLIICLVAVSLVVTIMGLSFSMIKDATIENTQNYIKFQANHVGGEIQKNFLLNDKSLNGIDINSIGKDSGRFAGMDLQWELDDSNKYVVLLNEGRVKEANNKHYDFYSSFCTSIQITKNDYFKKGIDVEQLPEKRTYDDIDENLDCIYDGNSFKIIYALDKIIKQ